MNIDDMIKQIEKSESIKLIKPLKIGILPNSGQIIKGFPEAILDFDHEKFTIYTFVGILKLIYKNEKYTFYYQEIKEIELVKYNFKDRYMKIIFEDDRFVAFAYKLNYNKYPNHGLNVESFFKQIESLAE